MKHSPIHLFAVAAILASAAPGSAAPLDRSKVVLPSAIDVDLAANTVTLPLYRGAAVGKTVWYIKTDVSDAAIAKAQGLLYAPALAAIGEGAQAASGDPSAFRFTGSVDFAPTRELRSGPDGSVTAAKPGSVGDANYSPFVRPVGTAVIYNAPIVASGDHPSDVTNHTDTLDRVVAIDTRDASRASVTLVLARGFTNGQPIAYISTDASDAGPAAIERSTYAPRLAKAGKSAAVPIDVFFNGRTDPQGQGIAFAALRGGLGTNASATNAESLASPLNIQATFPGATAPNGYTPLWAVAPAFWTSAAIGAGKAHRVTSSAGVAEVVRAGLVTGPGGKPFGTVGIVVDCPVVGFSDSRP
jgi:hypothetical protein